MALRASMLAGLLGVLVACVAVVIASFLGLAGDSRHIDMDAATPIALGTTIVFAVIFELVLVVGRIRRADSAVRFSS